MQKYKMALILYSSAIGVFYGVTTASAAPFRSWAHDFMVQSASAVTQFVSSSRDFDSKSGASIAAGPIVFNSGKLDPIAAFVNEIRRDYPTVAELDEASDGPEPGFGATTFNDDSPRSASPSNRTTSLDARNDPPVRFVVQDVNAPTAGRKPGNRDNLPRIDNDKDKDKVDAIGPVLDELIIASKEPKKDPTEPLKHGESDELPLIAANVPSSLTNPSFPTVQTIPEAATLALLGLGVAGLSFIRRRPENGELKLS